MRLSGSLGRSPAAATSLRSAALYAPIRAQLQDRWCERHPYKSWSSASLIRRSASSAKPQPSGVSTTSSDEASRLMNAQRLVLQLGDVLVPLLRREASGCAANPVDGVLE